MAFQAVKKTCSKLIVCLLALLLMNYSLVYNIPPADVIMDDNTAIIYNYASVNEIESVFELVTEEWLELENFVLEQEQDDAPEDVAKIKTLFLPVTHRLHSYIIGYFAPEYGTCLSASAPVFKANIPTPPPDVWLLS